MKIHHLLLTARRTRKRENLQPGGLAKASKFIIINTIFLVFDTQFLVLNTN